MSAEGGDKRKQSHWPKDRFGQSEIAQQAWWLAPFAIALLGLLLLSGVQLLRTDKRPTVILYAAQDQVFAEPILKKFTAETGIRVRAVYDSEAVKTVGLANRLLAERRNPQCDVFWGNEELRTRQLAAAGVFGTSNGWVAFGFRTRRLVINTNRVTRLGEGTPLRLHELTNAAWQGKVALAYPMFGTTSTHFLALRQAWGEAAWRAWCRGLQAGRPFLTDGNSQVVKLVGRGEAWIGLTDSDDIAAGKQDGLPIMALPTTPETLLIPNTVALVHGGPHPIQARQLFAYLQRREVGELLLGAEALEGWTPGLRPHLTVDWEAVLRDLGTATAEMKSIFLE
jgi:iron(III) transport system substrate-binding protein